MKHGINRFVSVVKEVFKHLRLCSVFEKKSGGNMNLDQKCSYLNLEALDRGFTMEKQFIGNIARISFSDKGKVGMDMEISDTDIVVPFARLTQYADESFADFALEVLGTDFKRGASN